MTQSYNPFDDEGDVLIQEQEVVQADNPFDDVVIESTPPDLPIQAVSYNPFDDLDEGNEIDETGVVVSEEPTIARKVAYGASQEPMILGSVGRLVETAYETVFEGKDWEEARADTEAERQEEIFEDFPEFKGGKYDDDGEVIVGKVATAIADPVTYLVPWVKAAKAGKLVLGATGAMTASGEYALHSYALTGEVDPKMLSIVAGSGGTLAVGGDIFIKFLSKRYSKGLTEEQIINKVERRIIKGRDDINDLTAKEQQVITDSFKLASVKDFYGQLKHIDNNTKHLVALKELRASRKAGTITEEVFQTTKTKLNAVLDRKFADMTDMRTAAQVEIAELLYKNKSFSTKAFEVAIRPMFGTLMLGGAGIALDADDSQLYTLMAIGFGSGALSRKLKYNTFLPQKVKQDIMKSVFKRNVAFTLRNIDVNFSATLATKGKALGAETGQFSDMMFHQFKSKGARQLSVEERSTMAYNHWMMTLYDDVIKKSTKKTQTSAVKILRGYDKDSDNTSEALELAGRFRDFFDDYRMYHTDVDIHAVTELDHYFPREYNFDIINKNGKAFKDVLAFIYGKQNPKLTPEKAQKAANGFIKNFYLNSNAPVSEINKQGRQVLDTLPFIKHLQKERELHGTIDIDGIPTQIEELLEPWLKNDPTEILSNMIKESTKTVEFARTWGAKGELLRRLRKKIHDKYAGTAEDKRLYKEHNREIKYINDSINAYFGRYGISDWGGHNAAGSIAMYNNLAMLEDVTLANLGDLIQPFQNSTFFKSAIKGIKITSATKTKTALNSKEPARYLAIGPTNQLQDEIQELSGITNNAAKIISKTNQGFFKMIGLQNITSYARRFAYNTGAIDAFETAKKWTKLNNKNIRAIEKKTGKKWSEFTKEEHIKLIVGSKLTKQTEILRKRLGYAGISTKQAKTLSTFDNFDEAFKSDYKYLLNSAGFRAMERDAKIPTVGNRLLYTQSKNPWLKLVGQFASWAQAKTAQVNSLVSRMEDGEAKLAVKMAGLLSIYGGVKTLREVIADGELSNESKDWAKFLADANQLSGNVGFFGNLASQQYINKYGNDPLNFFPAASTLSKGAEAVRSIDITDPLALTPEIKKILPMPKTINILERTFGREVFEEPSIYKEREYEESKGYSVGGLVSQAERLGFNKGGAVSLDNTSNNSIGIGEQQRLEDYSNTSDNLLPITEGNVVEEPSMWDNISTDYDKRLKSMDESRKDRESREISLVRSTVNTAGAIAGLGFDVAGAVIEESVSTYLDNLKSFAPTTYKDTAEKVTEAKDWALNTEAGQVAVAAAQKGYEEYSIWKKDNPQDAKTFEAVLNIGMFGWGAKGIASQMLKRKKPEVLPPINQTKIPPLLVDKTKQGLKVYSDKNASFLNVKKIDDSMVVTNVNVDPTLRRRGVALSMYEEAVKDATTRGVNLTSDMTVKLSAIGVYKKLEALGYDVSFNKNTTDVVNDYGVITRFSTDDLPVVTVHTKKPTEVLPITNKEAERDTALMTLLDDLPVGKQLVIDNSKDYYENDIDYNSAEWFENIARGSEVTVDGNNIIIKKIKEIKLGDIETAVVFPESGKVTIMIPQAGELILEKGGKYNNIEGEWSIETVGLSDEFKNKGLGVKLYLKAVEELLKKGDYAASYLSSGGMTTESAMRVWRSLYKNPDKYLKEFPQLKGTFSIHTNEKNMIVHDNGPKGEKQYEQDIDSEPAYSIELDPSAYEKNIIKRRTPKKPKAAMPAKKTQDPTLTIKVDDKQQSLERAPVGMGLEQMANDNIALVGGLRSGNSKGDETRLKYTVYDYKAIQANNDMDNANDYILGDVELFVEDGTGKVRGLVELNIKDKRKGTGRKVIEALMASDFVNDDFNIHSIKKSAIPFWEKMGIEFNNKRTIGDYRGDGILRKEDSVKKTKAAMPAKKEKAPVRDKEAEDTELTAVARELQSGIKTTNITDAEVNKQTVQNMKPVVEVGNSGNTPIVMGDVEDFATQSEIVKYFHTNKQRASSVGSKSPERQMLDLQKVMGGGVMSDTIEHAGDLLWRMTHNANTSDDWFDAGGIKEKTTRLRRSLESSYGFHTEFLENIKNNNDYLIDEGLPGVNLKEVKTKLTQYGEAHAKLPVYNRAQWVAREVPIAISKTDYPKAITLLKVLDEWLDNGEFNAEAGRIHRDSTGKVLEYTPPKPLVGSTSSAIETQDPTITTKVVDKAMMPPKVSLVSRLPKKQKDFNLEQDNHDGTWSQGREYPGGEKSYERIKIPYKYDVKYKDGTRKPYELYNVGFDKKTKQYRVLKVRGDDQQVVSVSRDEFDSILKDTHPDLKVESVTKYY